MVATVANRVPSTPGKLSFTSEASALRINITAGYFDFYGRERNAEDYAVLRFNPEHNARKFQDVFCSADL